MQLSDSVTVLKGIGPSRAKQLEKLNIRTLYDLLAYFPRDYEDRTKLANICDLVPGEPACFEAMVISNPTTAHIRKGMDITRLKVADETGRLNLTFFNQNYVKDQLQYGESYYFYGALQEDFGASMASPSFERVDSSGTVTNRILPIYGLTAGLSNKVLISCVRQALDACGDALPEILPEQVRRRYHLCGVRMAYESVHNPASLELLMQAKKRLVFEEFFIFSAGLALLREKRTGVFTDAYDTSCIRSFCDALPFRLTDAQLRAIEEIGQDLQKGVPMNRLVQGDVGSGKTVIAAAACLCAVKNGRQAAFMAPTEILAEQHAENLSRMLAPFGISVVLLTGSVTGAARKLVLAAIADGSAQLVIGTHALISEGVTFADLGLVVADEQHRFGVAQRAALTAKGISPHLLVMSATPIPRTLALIAYGDLDVSIVDELPPGRLPVQTFLVDESYRKRINAFIRKQCGENHQVYIVCPAVEEGDDDTLKSAEVWAETLQSAVFPDLRVGLLHGKMKGSEKEAVLGAFSRHEVDILVSTTVIEVGVDVPNATLIVIENADRFGLAQLHQLRGRVGRGKAQSYCVLFSSSKNAETKKRLQALCKTTDGFKISEEDLALRGPGDFFGSRQHGLPLFKVASLQMDLQTLKDAQRASAEFIRSANSLDDPAMQPLKERIQILFSQDSIVLN